MANSTKFWPWPTVHRGAPCACGVQVNLVVLVIVLRRVRRHRALAASVKHRGVHSVWWVRFVPLVAYDDVKIYEVLSAWKITWFTVVFDQRPIRVAVLRSRQTVTWVHASWQTMLFSVNMINNIYHTITATAAAAAAIGQPRLSKYGRGLWWVGFHLRKITDQ